MLVRRGDGQVLQLSPLLYTLASSVDGEAAVGAVADRVSARTTRRLTSEGVEYLLEQKLGPLGLLASEGRPPGLPRARPLLALGARRRVIAEPTVNRLAAVLEQLFRPAAVALVLVALALVDYALLVAEGVGPSLQAMAMKPAFLFAVLALLVLSTFFHELGHAAGCRYGGGRPGVIGVGIYLVWPAFYTNVNDAYRLSKAGRLRTDLGGGYFSLISVVAFGAAYAASSWPPFAIAIVVVQLQLLPQLLPIVRFDGYYVLSDLVGLPDLFSRVGPILRNLFRRRPRDPRVRDLRPRIRLVVTAWVLTVVPLLAGGFGLMLLHLPAYLRDSWQALGAQLRVSERAVGNADVLGVALGAVHVIAVVIPVAGITLVIGRLGRTSVHQAQARRRRAAVAAQPGRPRPRLPLTGPSTVMSQQANSAGALHDRNADAERSEPAAAVERPTPRMAGAAPPIRGSDDYPRRKRPRSRAQTTTTTRTPPP